MNALEWRAIQSLFAEAQALAPGEREVLLEARAVDAPHVATEVRRLLQAAEESVGFLVPPEAAQLAQPLRLLPEDVSGLRLGEFTIVREIGRGTSGTVYLGWQASVGREVAIKILAPQYAVSDERRARFRREAQAASKVHHENVVQVLSFGDEGGVCYLVLEHVSGRDLHALVQSKLAERAAGRTARFEPREAARIVEGVARGLAACHAAGVLHRDVKPHNILLDGRGVPRLVDFGLAKDEALGSLSAAGSVAGTPQYMSPEQAHAESPVDARSDVYSAGAVLYELLTLRPPADGPGTAAILQKVAHGRPEHLRLVAPDVPAALQDICMRALSRDPQDRHPTAEALAADLAQFRRGGPVPQRVGWVLRDRLTTLGAEHPWLIVGACALLLLGVQPMAKTPAPARAASPNLSEDPPSIEDYPVLMDLLEQLSDEPTPLPDDD